MWRSLVAHLIWDQGVAGSNPVIPTKFFPPEKHKTKESTMGYSQVVRQRVLAPSFVGSNPATPANERGLFTILSFLFEKFLLFFFCH